ncbi:DUF1854 domain-containing protein [Piscinibacter sakaiensis]|uniref:cyanophycin metabolism-associated DUF1854 family protein n=1 Tax=Piscinibacter sakaiensis TaxID=1547922 RepID=UPI003AAFD3EC
MSAADHDVQAFDLQRDAFGRLMLSAGDGQPGEEVMPVRAFPLAAPEDGISLVGTDGHERRWIPKLGELPAQQRDLLREALAELEFLPTILRIASVSTFSTPSHWAIDTDRGATELVLKGEEDIRRLADGGLLIADAVGLQYRIPDPKELDRHSRRLLERFL